jgi:uroporphyrinogen decarboxylase
MTHRERIRALAAGQEADQCGFWLGMPHEETWPLLHDYFKTTTQEELRLRLNDDIRWINPGESYKHPEGKPMFINERENEGLAAGGVFAHCEDVDRVEAHEWPDPGHLDFTGITEVLKDAGDVYRASGFWSPFFHEAADFFGMENYFIKMYTHPDVVHAVTKHLVDFYLEASRRFFEATGDLTDAFFFGNDFGTQQDLLISPGNFQQFVFPYFKQLTDLGHRMGKQVILHSCGAIAKVIPNLIELGVDVLHPLQAKAAGMEAKELAKFKGQVTFMGGIDTQDLLVNGTPEQVKADVQRVKEILSPRLIISPSHEALLPNIPPQNIQAMAEAVR